jgi:hypothetical protein
MAPTTASGLSCDQVLDERLGAREIERFRRRRHRGRIAREGAPKERHVRCARRPGDAEPERYESDRKDGEHRCGQATGHPDRQEERPTDSLHDAHEGLFDEGLGPHALGLRDGQVHELHGHPVNRKAERAVSGLEQEHRQERTSRNERAHRAAKEDEGRDSHRPGDAEALDDRARQRELGDERRGAEHGVRAGDEGGDVLARNRTGYGPLEEEVDGEQRERGGRGQERDPKHKRLRAEDAEARGEAGRGRRSFGAVGGVVLDAARKGQGHDEECTRRDDEEPGEGHRPDEQGRPR